MADARNVGFMEPQPPGYDNSWNVSMPIQGGRFIRKFWPQNTLFDAAPAPSQNAAINGRDFIHCKWAAEVGSRIPASAVPLGLRGSLNQACPMQPGRGRDDDHPELPGSGIITNGERALRKAVHQGRRGASCQGAFPGAVTRWGPDRRWRLNSPTRRCSLTFVRFPGRTGLIPIRWSFTPHTERMYRERSMEPSIRSHGAMPPRAAPRLPRR